MHNRDITWTNTSVLKFAHGSDPVHLITEKARYVVLQAVQAGWQGRRVRPG